MFLEQNIAPALCEYITFITAIKDLSKGPEKTTNAEHFRLIAHENHKQ